MTVGLVIVSHSAQLARGVAELAGQMAQGKTPIVAAGGAGEQILGTNPDTIVAAMQSLAYADGVLVLLDMGGAILSTEMALEFLDEEQRSRVQLTFAPIVEGAVAAALEASLGHSLAEVKRAAEQTAHTSQLRQLKPLSQEDTEIPTQVAPHEQAMSATTLVAEQPHTLNLPLHNPTGLHARPAGLVVQTVAQFQAKVRLQSHNKEADAASLIAILSLGARNGDTVTFTATGPDAEPVLAALKELVQADFYETTAEERAVSTPVVREKPENVYDPAQAVTTTTTWHAVKTSAGVALGSAFLYTSHITSLKTLEQRSIAPEQVHTELQQLRTALTSTAQELHVLAQQQQTRIGTAEAAIFDAHALMVEDPVLLEDATQHVEQQHLDAASALALAAEAQAALLETLDDSLLAARAVDVRDAVSRVIRKLRPAAFPQQDLSALHTPIILLAADLTPSDTVLLRPEYVLGICTVHGGPTAHAAILARALGIPAIAGLNEALLRTIQPGQELGLDADNGMLYMQVTEEVRSELTKRLAEQRQQQATLKANMKQHQEPLVIDGQQIALFANVGTPGEADAAAQWGAEGIGLLRTEFLLANTLTMPNEEEQRQKYVQVFRAFSGSNIRKPIIVRTLDAGADKPMPALQSVLGPLTEANPALGLRGIRIHLAHHELLETQFRALLLAAADTGVELHIMVPMLSTVEELREVRSIFERVYQEMKQRGTSLPTHVPLGIMVEVPAAVAMAPELATLADFFSIGANDLLQYTLACDRTNTSNPILTSLYNPMQPAVFRLIHQVAQAARQAGKLVAVCGEIASDPRLAPLLVGLGVQELSMTPNALPQIRAVLQGRTMQELTQLAERVLHAETVQEVERYVS